MKHPSIPHPAFFCFLIDIIMKIQSGAKLVVIYIEANQCAGKN